MPKSAKTKKQLEQEIAELTEALQRERADAENIRKRSEQERSNALQLGEERAVLKLLAIFDDLDRGLSHVPEDLKDHAYVKGIQSLKKNLDKLSTEIGLEKMDVIGKPFDPEIMQAISMDDKGGEKELVSEELQTGYMLNGRIIREPMVKVTK